VEEKISRKALEGVLLGRSAEDVKQKCLAELGSALCRDIAELRNELVRAVGRNESTYIVAGDHLLIVVPADDNITVSKLGLDEGIREYWPFCGHGHEFPTIHGTDFWICCGEERQIHDNNSFREVLAWLKQRLAQEQESGVRQAAVRAIEERFEALAKYEMRLAKANIDSVISWMAQYVESWVRHFAELGRLGEFLERLRDVAGVLTSAGISIEGLTQAAEPVRSRVIVARRETLEEMLGRGRIEDSVQKCFDAYRSGACGHLAAARVDVLRAIGSQRTPDEVHYVVAGDVVFDVQSLPGGWASIKVLSLDEAIKTYMPLDPEDPSKMYGIFYWYLPHRTVKADSPSSYLESLLEIRRWLTEGSANIRSPTPEMRRAALNAVAERLEYVNRLLSKQRVQFKVSV